MNRAGIVIGFIKQHGFRAVAEIGGGDGSTTRQVIAQCSLDVYLVVERCMHEGNAGLYRVLEESDEKGPWGTSLKPVVFMRMDSVSAARYIADGSLDLVYIDADHLYDGVKHDIICWLPKVRIGGIICGHDYDLTGGFTGLIEAVHEMCGEVATINTGGEDNNHVWWTSVDESLLSRVLSLSGQVAVPDTVVEDVPVEETDMTRQELLIKFIKDNDFRSMAEIGVAEGWTAEPVMRACDLDLYVMVEPSLVDCNAVLYDVMKRTDVLDDFRRTQKPAVLMRMDSVSAARYIADGSLDLVYIDAEHTYDNVKADIIAWISKIRDGGILCGHDYDPTGNFTGLIQAVHEVLENDYGLILDGGGGDNNHIWWTRVDADRIERVLSKQAVASSETSAEHFNLEGVPDNLKEYVSKFEQYGQHLDL